MLYRCCLRILVTSPLMSLQFYWLFSAPFALLWLRTVQGCYKQLGCSRCYYSRNMYFTPCKWFPPGRGRGSCMQAGTLTPAPPHRIPPTPCPTVGEGAVKMEGVWDPTQVQRWLLRFYLYLLHCDKRGTASVIHHGWGWSVARVIRKRILGDFGLSLLVTWTVRFSSLWFV